MSRNMYSDLGPMKQSMYDPLHAHVPCPGLDDLVSSSACQDPSVPFRPKSRASSYMVLASWQVGYLGSIGTASVFVSQYGFGTSIP